MKRCYLLIIFLILLSSCSTSVKPPVSYLKEKAKTCKERAFIFYEAGLLPEALKEALLAKEANPKDPEIYNLLGLIWLDSKDPEKALKFFKKALELNPNYSEALNNVGAIYLLKGDLDNATEYFNKALQNPLYEKPFIALTNLGHVYYLKGNKEKAQEYLNKALIYNPRYSLAYFYKGLIALENNMLEKAEMYFRRAVIFDRRDMGARYYLGLTYFRLGKQDKAAEIWRSIIQLEPESKWAFQAENMLITLEEKEENSFTK